MISLASFKYLIRIRFMILKNTNCYIREFSLRLINLHIYAINISTKTSSLFHLITYILEWYMNLLSEFWTLNFKGMITTRNFNLKSYILFSFRYTDHRGKYIPHLSILLSTL